MRIDDLRRGDIVAVRGTSFLDRGIEDVTHSVYSHVAMVTGVNELIEAQAFEKVCYRDTGVYAGHADVFRHNSLPPPIASKIVTYAEKHQGQRYDYPLILWELIRYVFGFMLPYQEHHSVICSTLIADAYREVGYKICPNVKYPSPADIMQSDFFMNMGPLVG